MSIICRAATIFIILVFLSDTDAAAVSASPHVVASTAPVHSLVAAVMRDVGEPELLVRGQASPHGYTLRPSEARLLHQADVVFWIGEGMETFLVKPLQTLSEKAVNAPLHEAEGITLLPYGEENHERGHESAHEEHGEEEEHEHGQWDMHIWLDPQNAIAMTRTIADVLSEADPDNAALYEKNAEEAIARLTKLDISLKQRLAPVSNRPFVVFHDGWRYLVKRYDLRFAGALTLSPDHPPSAARLAAIRDRMREDSVICLFAEPQVRSHVTAAVTENTTTHTGILDPLGANLKLGPDFYGQLMNNIADTLAHCLAEDE